MTGAIVPVIKSLTKSAICQILKKPARQGSKLADKGAYIDVSDCSLQAQLTQQTKILTTFLLFVRIFVFAGFVRGLMTGAIVPVIIFFVRYILYQASVSPLEFLCPIRK